MLQYILEDIERAKSEDPAAPSTLVVMTCYSGLHALWSHRVEHWLWERGHHGISRWMSQCSRFFTGVEIHPGAQIGRRVFIDHGMGIVIGETTIIGDDCTLYQGCTLGGTGKETGKRHPTLANNVTVGVGAAVLGNIQIGDNSKIGGGAVVVNDVPSDCTVVGIPGKVVKRKGETVAKSHDPEKRQEDLPDPVISLIGQLQRRIDVLDRRVDMLRALHGDESGMANEPDVIEVKPDNVSLTAQMLEDENRIRAELGRRTLDHERASTSSADRLGFVSDAVATLLGDRVAQAPADATKEDLANIVADALKELSKSVRKQA